MCVGIYKALRHKGSFSRKKNSKINFTISYTGLVGLSINLAALPVLVSKQPLKNWVHVRFRSDLASILSFFKFCFDKLLFLFSGDDDHVTISATGGI